jgi:hypothetical protein
MLERGTRDERVRTLVRIGEKLVIGDDPAEVDAYVAPAYRFHGPGGAEFDYEGLHTYFAALRNALDDLKIKRGIVVVEGDYIACQTTIEGSSALPDVDVAGSGDIPEHRPSARSCFPGGGYFVRPSSRRPTG